MGVSLSHMRAQRRLGNIHVCLLSQQLYRRLEFKSIMYDASGLHTNGPLKHVNITGWSLTSALTVLIWMNIAGTEPQFWKFQ